MYDYTIIIIYPKLNDNEYNVLPSDSFMSFLHSLLGYSSGQFNALQLFVLAAFGSVD